MTDHEHDRKGVRISSAPPVRLPSNPSFGRRRSDDTKRRAFSRAAQLGFQADHIAEQVAFARRSSDGQRHHHQHQQQARLHKAESTGLIGGQGVRSDTRMSLDASFMEEAHTVKEIAAAMYDKIQEDELPNFITHVRLNQDGGLERLGEIWDSQKYIWCILLFATVAFNVIVLLTTNWAIFQSIMCNYVETDQEIVKLLFSGNVSSSLRVATNVTEGLSNGGAKSIGVLRKSSDMADMFKHIEDADTRAKVSTVAGAVASFEVLYIIWYLVDIAKSLAVFAFGQSEFQSYDAIMELVRLTLPQMSTFSALKLIGRVHPALIYGEFLDFRSKSTDGFAVALAWFVLSRIFFGVTAVSAFAVKLLIVGFRFVDPRLMWAIRWAAVIALLNNCMGIVLFERVLQDRLFLFVFGGQDTDYQDDERALLHVYLCRIAKKVWTSYWQAGQRIKAVVLLVTLDHFDLQRLLIDDLNLSPVGIHNGSPTWTTLSETPTLLTHKRREPLSVKV